MTGVSHRLQQVKRCSWLLLFRLQTCQVASRPGVYEPRCILQALRSAASHQSKIPRLYMQGIRTLELHNIIFSWCQLVLLCWSELHYSTLCCLKSQKPHTFVLHYKEPPEIKQKGRGWGWFSAWSVGDFFLIWCIIALRRARLLHGNYAAFPGRSCAPRAEQHRPLQPLPGRAWRQAVTSLSLFCLLISCTSTPGWNSLHTESQPRPVQRFPPPPLEWCFSYFPPPPPLPTS